MNEDRRALEAQLRETYGRIVYTHKTHEVMADLYDDRSRCIKLWQIIFSAITASGAAGTVLTDVEWVSYATAFLSLLTVFLTSYATDINPEAWAQKHRQIAADMWNIREGYLSLLADIQGVSIAEDVIREMRDRIQLQLHEVYKSAPHTTGKAYKIAQERLQKKEDMTFSKEEIDKFLPPDLRKSERGKL